MTRPNLQLKIGCTPEELKKAQRLRFEVFDLEMAGRSKSFARDALDKDEFDPACEHIIVVDADKDIVVGTYRMLLDSVASKSGGFYSETKFNMDAIKRLEGAKLEVGRSCVHKDYRDHRVLNLLWQGITQYTVKNQVKYIFGCANLMTSDPQEISRYFCAFKALGLFHDHLHVLPKSHPIKVDENLKIENPKKMYDELPTLFKGYMNVGLKVCGYPVVGDFGIAVFFVLLDIQNMNSTYKKRFFGDYLSQKKKAH